MPNPFVNAASFLFEIVFNFYIFVVMLRIVLQWVKTDPRNQIFEFTARLTNLPLKPLRRIIPSWHGIDIGAIVLLLALEVLYVWLKLDMAPTFSSIVVLAFAELLQHLINLFSFAIFILALLSWFNPVTNNQIVEILYRLTEPLLRPARRILPPIAGLDLSPLVVLVILRLLIFLIVDPLLQIGVQLTLAGAVP